MVVYRRKAVGSLLINGHHRAEIAWHFAPRLLPTSERMARTVHSTHVQCRNKMNIANSAERRLLEKGFIHACMFVYVECSSPSRRQSLNILIYTEAVYCSLTMTYGISTSSSSWSSAVISKMTFFWCSGTGFLLTCSTSLLILDKVSIRVK
jgi:hypothetical protein